MPAKHLYQPNPRMLFLGFIPVGNERNGKKLGSGSRLTLHSDLGRETSCGLYHVYEEEALVNSFRGRTTSQYIKYCQHNHRGECFLALVVDTLQHVVDARLGRVGISCRIIGPFADIDDLHSAIFHIEGAALTARVTQNAHNTGVIKNDIQGLSQLTPGVRKEGDVGTLNVLRLCPSSHDGTIIHAEHNHLVDSCCLQAILPAKVARNLTRGSRGCERTRKADHDGLLACKAFGHLDRSGREA